MSGPSIGRWCELNGVDEIDSLAPGLDFRRPEYRREVFLRFYDFHLRYRSHPGGVYYLIPALSERYGWTTEQAYWWAFLNGDTQHPVTTTLLWLQFPDVSTTDPEKMQAVLDKDWKRLEFDTDRRYWKVKIAKAVANYQSVLGGDTQEQFFSHFTTANEADNFSRLWAIVRSSFLGFGRLSAWSYIEYLRVLGLPVAPADLMLSDRDGSKSHRNGLCKVLGRDDLEWRDGEPLYTKAIYQWLEYEAAILLEEARVRMYNQPFVRDITHLTLESTLCCYKSWHRPNRRYPNVYNDMLHDRIKRAEQAWRSYDLDVRYFWEIRRKALPDYLRLEDNPRDVGLHPDKQNHYLRTGQVIMMDREWPCFANDYSTARIG